MFMIRAFAKCAHVKIMAHAQLKAALTKRSFGSHDYKPERSVVASPLCISVAGLVLNLHLRSLLHGSVIVSLG